MDGWMDGWEDGWMDGWVDGWMDGWVDGRMDECICVYLFEFVYMRICVSVYTCVHHCICMYLYIYTAHNATVAPVSDCAATMCPGNSTEGCGGRWRMSVFESECVLGPAPHYHCEGKKCVVGMARVSYLVPSCLGLCDPK